MSAGQTWIHHMENGQKLYYYLDATGKWVQSRDPFGEDKHWFESASPRWSKQNDFDREFLASQNQPIPMHHLLNFVS